MAFGEKFKATDNIKAILDAYPFSIGIFREILQNSDDAGAKEQVFVLDTSTHHSDNINDPRLAETQGPALLAYNEGNFSDDDWEALQSVHSSSKRTDTSKIGKYGIGFRSSYHTTDHPQVMSKNSLAIFDPHSHIFRDGGKRVDIQNCEPQFSDIISAFDSVLPPGHVGPLNGTAFRLPFRVDSGSEISSKIVTAQEMKELIDKFVAEELDIVLLFLRNVEDIKIYVVDAHGTRTLHSHCKISRSDPHHIDSDFSRTPCEITTEIAGASAQTSAWWTLHSNFSVEEASQILSDTLGREVKDVLKKNKLSPGMALAIQRDYHNAPDKGRLFTFLPLPLKTRFPLHVHGLFSLTQSRQNLRNMGEIKGVLESSDDRVFLGWNAMLFDVYLPRLWAALLNELSTTPSPSPHIFDAWPQPQPDVEGVDSANWKAIPQRLVDEVVRAGSRVWPVASSQGIVLFLGLGEVMLLSDAPSQYPPPVDVLARAGVNVARIPSYIYDILHENHIHRPEISFLTPSSLARHLRTHPNESKTLPSLDKNSLLEYLVSDQRLQNVVDLPLIPLPDDTFVALQRSGSISSDRHTLLSKPGFDVFSSFDNKAIALHLLPERVANLLQTKGPTELNVQHLDNNRVVAYLASLSDRPSTWVYDFWTWLVDIWGNRETLFHSIKPFDIIPCNDGKLRQPSGTVFVAGRPSNVFLETGLHKLGISFLSSEFPPAAREFLVRRSGAKLLDDVGPLLDCIEPHGGHLDVQESAAILQHFLDQPSSYQKLGNTHCTKLRQLPLFPLLVPTPDGLTINRVTGRLSSARQIEGVTDINTIIENLLLPPVSDISFLDLSSPNNNLLLLVQPTRQPLSVQELLQLSLRTFQSQPAGFHLSLVEYVAAQQSSIPSSIIDSLGKTPFLHTKNGQIRSPREVIDPSSPIAILFTGPSSEGWLPAHSEGSLVRDLQKLGLLQRKLSTAVVNGRINHISSAPPTSPSALKLARLLLDSIQTEYFDCSEIDNSSEKRWIPTEKGLRSHKECLDPGLYRQRRELFDEVLDVAQNIPGRLHTRFGWATKVPLDILFEQFRRLVDKQDSTKLETVISELSSRQLSPEHYRELQDVVRGKSWIPTDKLKLFPTTHAVFSAESTRGQMIPDFYEFPDFSYRPQLRSFYLSMGCCETPSVSAMLSVLQGLKTARYKSKAAYSAVILLECMVDNLSPDQRVHLLVPDITYELRPIADVVYKDVTSPILLDPDLHFTDAQIGHTLASKLGIPFLGHRELKSVQNLAEYDMEEKLTTKIKNTLSQYSKQQLLMEMLANAIDAGATRFDVLVDDSRGGTDHLLSPSMAEFQDCPSLVVYNDAVFSNEDFRGICNLGMGAKYERLNTIGQFGLGALTMFHLTNLPMIVSGDHIMFLDPSKSYLPFEHRTAILLNWREILRLPLKDPFTAAGVLDDFITPFRRLAVQSLLFTPLMAGISASSRKNRGVKENHWHLTVDRHTDHEDSTYVSKQLLISSTKLHTTKQAWRVVLGKDIFPLPDQYLELRQNRRIRSPIVVGLAAEVTGNQKVTDQPSENMHLFSTLPLPVASHLPVHLTAPFILSPDRRNIRLESNYDKLEAQFNRWLLSDLAPNLYYFLLEELVVRHHEAGLRWWPRRTDEGLISKTVVESLYQSLATTPRRVFMTNLLPLRPLLPSEAIISGREPSVITDLLSVLETRNRVVFNTKDKDSFGRWDGIVRMVDGALVRSEILRAKTTFLHWMNSAVAKTIRLETLIRFILSPSSQSDVSQLKDLPLIPLANGGLGSFGTPVTYYFLPTSSPKSHATFLELFPSGRLIDQAFSLWSCLLGKGLNISELSPSAVRDLLRGKIPEGDCQEVTRQEAYYIEIFWKIFSDLPTDTIKELTTFTLFPTTAGTYLSAAYYRNPSVIVATSFDEAWLVQCIAELGAIVIKREHIRHLPTGCLPEKSPLLRALLSYFQQLNSAEIRNRFQRLGPSAHQRFAEWFRGGLGSAIAVDKSIISVVKCLPIWPVYEPNSATGDTVMRPMDGISVLSASFTSKMTQFIRRFTTVSFASHSYLLEQMNTTQISAADILQYLQLPVIMEERDIEDYKSIVSLVLGLGRRYSGTIRVPNGNRVMAVVGDLYAYDSLFRAAFPVNDFPHPLFRDEKSRLHQHGLKVQEDLSIPLFTQCAQAFHDNRYNDQQTMLDRARIMYQIFCEDLPLKAGPFPSWGGLSHLRFIPSSDSRDQRSSWRQYIEPRLAIVSPAEVMLDSLAAIAWTQRTFTATRPHQRLTLANNTFGVPTAQEVVQHLQCLVGIAELHPSNGQISHDLAETYDWLDKHSEEARSSMLNLHGQNLFLNVDDPTTETWTGRWKSSDHLLFNLYWDAEPVFKIRKFLARFPSLLRVSGVRQVENPQAPQANLTSNETLFANQRTNFARLREQRKLVDVKFVSGDEQEFWAHRSFLVSVSDYFESLFCDAGMVESGPASTNEPIVVSMNQYDAESVGSVLAFLYTGLRPEVARSGEMDIDVGAEEAALGRFFELIELSRYWRVWDVFEYMQVRMIEERMINPGTVSAILEESTQYNAEHLMEACQTFLSTNAEVMSNIPMSEA
ncbi:hypothetical protein V5O48_006085 [Marasmius crinis-equi]|uniref:BTB domain-containing protein n=1 Tax=Marasmius crinis-equi TaxID=585013 RepID=A0ABR3FKI9_9AGAR